MIKPIAKGNPRPITRRLLADLEKRAAEAAAAVEADAELLSCQHPNIERGVSSFCGQCGALVNLAAALWGNAPSGMAFALQQIIRGNAIAEAQRRGALLHSRRRISSINAERMELRKWAVFA
jgi:hypothetical protein